MKKSFEQILYKKDGDNWIIPICGTEMIFHDKPTLGCIVINLLQTEEISAFIDVAEKANIGNNQWLISLTSPEYLRIDGDKMTVEEKEEFISIMNEKWTEILDKIEYGCEMLCGEDKHTCKYYCNRKIKDMPNYNLLEVK